VAFGRGPVGPGEQREPVVQPGRDLRGVECPHPCGGQLDRERQPVETTTDLHDHFGIRRVKLEIGAHRGGPLAEQPHRRALFWTVDCERQRRDREQALAADPQSLTARGEETQARAGAEEPRGEAGGGVDAVLAVVEDDERVLVGEVLLQAGSGVVGGRLQQAGFAGADRAQDRRRDVRVVTHRRKLHQPDTLRRKASHARCGLDGETRLPRAPGTGDRDQAGRGDRRREGLQVRFTADEAGELRLQVGALLDARGGGALAQDLEVELGELGGRVGTELVGEAFAGALEHVEGLGRAAGRIERPHEEGLPALVERICLGERFEFGEHVGAGGDLEREPLPRGFTSQAFQADRFVLGEPQVAQVGESRAAPERCGLAERREVAVSTARLGQPLEPRHVHVARLDRETVPGGAPGEPLGADHAAHAGDQGLQRVGGRSVVLPDRVEQRICSDLAARFEREAGDERAQPRPGELDGLVVGVADLEGTEEEYAHESKCARDRRGRWRRKPTGRW